MKLLGVFWSKRFTDENFTWFNQIHVDNKSFQITEYRQYKMQPSPFRLLNIGNTNCQNSNINIEQTIVSSFLLSTNF